MDAWWPCKNHGDQVYPDTLQNGLILSGGGARAAYQVGVLMGIAELIAPTQCNPFPILCGTSAGAINAVGLAARAKDFRISVRHLEKAWRAMTPDDVFKTNLGAFAKELLSWALPAFITGSTPRNSALLNNSPLCQMLGSIIPFEKIQEAIDDGYLQALSVTASSYSNNESVSFFQAKDGLIPWQRVRRRGERTNIRAEHLLASAALPVLFPAQNIDNDYYGDGAMRQLAPLSPALHLGADRVLVIGVSGKSSFRRQVDVANPYPSLAKVLGHVLDSVFVDTLENDVERLERINDTLDALPLSERKARNLRHIDVLKIYPSQSIDEIAAEYLHLLPWRLRMFLRGPGGTRSSGASAVSYLLFEEKFIEALIDLGLSDARRHQKEICSFLNPKTASAGSVVNESVPAAPLDSR